MPAFHYLALAPGGGAVRGRVEAENRVAALSALDAMGLVAQTLAEGRAGALTTLLSADLGGGRASAAPLRAFTRELALLLQARIGLEPALSMLIDESGREFRRLPLADLLRRVRSGDGLAEAMAAHPDDFRPDYIGIVRVGQASGTLGAALTDLAQMLERSAAQRGRLASALAYPAILLLAAFGTIAVLVQVVLPSFAPLFARAGLELPWTTRLVLSAADLAPTIGLAMLAVLLAAAAIWFAAGQDPVRRQARDGLALRIPLLGSLLLLQGLSSALRALGIMARSGLLLRPALKIAAGGARNAAIAAMLEKLGAALERGDRLSDTLRAEPLVPAMVPRLVRIGEESGALADAFLHLAELLDTKLQHRLTRGLALVTPLLTAAIGGIVAFVLTAVMSALLGANELALG